MQDDGNFVLYDQYRNVIWSTGTYPYSGAFLQIQDDGDLVVYTSAGQSLWVAGSSGSCPCNIFKASFPRQSAL